MIDGPRVAPAATGPARSLVVFLHGYGADGGDLIAIGAEWSKRLRHTAFVAPHAPELCAEAPQGRQWFALTFRDPQEFRRGVARAAPVLDAFLDREMERLRIDESAVALVGFSQGAMLALHAGPKRKKRLAGIVGYSGLLADPDALLNGGVERPPVLLVHGERDELIPAAATLAAAQGLGAAEIPVEWHIEPGIPHGIGREGMAMGLDFLARNLPG